jgi:alginate O-acetyltransferase complex protein AlgI
MAIGLSRLFGIILPLNFNSPYKSDSIAEFWRRWHMTLSRFLRDYLYVPLGGNRRGGLRRYVNLLIVMVLGGLWHGAAWTFVLWGALHGFYLVINHAWRAISVRSGFHLSGRLSHVAAVTLTFLAVVFAWVFFRAGNIETALLVARGMIGINGVAIPAAFKPILGPLASLLESWGVLFPLGHGAQFLKRVAWIAALLPIVFLFPNSQQILGRYRPGLNYPAQGRAWIEWRFTAGWAIAGAALAALGILSLSRVSEFLYFQF